MYLPMAVIAACATLFFSLVILLRLVFKKYRNNYQFVFHFFGSLASATFVFLAGGWAYISFWLRWVFLVLYLAGCVYMFIKRSRATAGKKGIGKWYYIVPRLAFTLVMCLAVFAFLSGRFYQGKAVDLKFPFKKGSYYIMQGGASRLTNPAHRNFSLSKYGFAMDISKLYQSGNRADGISPTHVEDYAIYGDTVFSPCAGKILLVRDSINNNKPGHTNTRFVHGNHIIIQCKGYRVFMAHFIKNKILVAEGQVVSEGTPLGLVGNSGFSAEPHLHLCVYKEYDTHPYSEHDTINARNERHINPAYDDYRYSGVSSPFTLDGNFYMMNDIIKK